MVTNATVPRVSRPREDLPSGDQQTLLLAMSRYREAEHAYRAAVLAAVEASSFRAVAELTGLSTNTIQRWKREVSAPPAT